MKNLFNSDGLHIANEVNGQLHSTTGQNIGHFLPNYNFFIDMNGNYLWEIIFENRLMYKTNNSFQHTNFGRYGKCGNVGNYGNPGSYGSFGKVSGYLDIEKEKLV